MKVFIGSSSESQHIAVEVERLIRELGHEAMPWYASFTASKYTLEQLMELAEKADAAVLVMGADDKIVRENGPEVICARDNVLIEAGLFYSSVGKTNVALCYLPDVKTPSDLSGVTRINFMRTDTGNRQFEMEYNMGELSKWLSQVEEKPLRLHRTMPDNKKFEDYMKSAKKELRIASYFFSAFHGTDGIHKALANGVSVKILLPAPWGNNWLATVAILDGVDASDERAATKMKTALVPLKDLYKSGKFSDRLEVRFVDCPLTNRITMIDPELESGALYVHYSFYENHLGPNLTYYLFHGDPLFDRVVEKFDKLWSAAEPFNLDKVEKWSDELSY